METTEEAYPTITSPITHSSATSMRSTVEVGISRPPMRTPVAGPWAWRCVDGRDVDERDVAGRDPDRGAGPAGSRATRCQPVAVGLALRSGVIPSAPAGRGRALPL